MRNNNVEAPTVYQVYEQFYLCRPIKAYILA